MARGLNAPRTRRALALAAALALTAGGCGTNKKAAVPGGVGPQLTTTPTSPGDTAAAGRAGGTSRSGGTPTTVRKTSGGTPTPNPAPTGADLRSASRGAPGTFAGILLAPGPAYQLVIDVLVQPGVSADESVISTLRQILAASSGKPVTVRGPVPLVSSSSNYTDDDIRRLADDQGKPEQGSGTAVIHLLYLKGSFSDEGVLGVTVRGDAIGIFPDQVDQAATALVSPARIERAVVTHELGHVLGLVDLFLDDGRDDADHPGHSRNPHSVMYWAVESDLVAQLLGGPPPVDFDGADQTDLRNIHSGAPRA